MTTRVDCPLCKEVIYLNEYAAGTRMWHFSDDCILSIVTIGNETYIPKSIEQVAGLIGSYAKKDHEPVLATMIEEARDILFRSYETPILRPEINTWMRSYNEYSWLINELTGGKHGN